MNDFLNVTTKKYDLKNGHGVSWIEEGERKLPGRHLRGRQRGGKALFRKSAAL